MAAAAPAYAADIGVPPPAAPPVYYPALYNWSGVYFGAHVGAGVLNDQFTQTTTTALQPAGTTTNVTPYSAIGGAQIGANYQWQHWVVGVEGTWTASAITGSQNAQTLLTPTFNALERSTSAPNMYATATARVGYAFDTLLLYAKGGAALMRVDYTQDMLVGGQVSSTQGFTDTRTGWTVGGGIEYGMTENLSAKIEYDFLDFGTKTYNFNNLSVSGLPVGNLPISISSMTHMFLLGIDYRFNLGGGGGPVARY